MDGWIGGWVGGWMDGWMGGWMSYHQRSRTTSLELSDAQSQTTSPVIRPVQVVTEDIFIWTVRPQRSVYCF